MRQRHIAALLLGLLLCLGACLAACSNGVAVKAKGQMEMGVGVRGGSSR